MQNLNGRYKPYKEASRITGLTELRLHWLRINGLAKSKIGKFQTISKSIRIPMICVDDALKWLGAKGMYEHQENDIE